MEFTNNSFPYCPDDCMHKNFMYCKKFNEECISFSENEITYQAPCFTCLEKDGYEPQVFTRGLVEKSDPVSIAYFHIPGFMHRDKTQKLIKLQQTYPSIFYPNRKIIEVYGAFAGAGVRPQSGCHLL